MSFRSEQDPVSVSYMIDLFKNINGKFYVEIGCAQLGTIMQFRDILPADGCAIGVDARSYPVWNEVPHNFPGSKLYLSDDGRDHQKALLLMMEALGDEKIDFLFIDGNHDIEPTMLDYKDFSSFVRKGGIIAFHDVDFGALKRGITKGQGGAFTLNRLAQEGYKIENVPGSIGIGLIRR